MLRIQGESISSERASTLWMLPLADRRGALTQAKGMIHSPLLGTATAALKQPTYISLSTKNLPPPAQMINTTTVQALSIVFHVESLTEAMGWN